jgi:GNAT superfamily N-acetyltransferase
MATASSAGRLRIAPMHAEHSVYVHPVARGQGVGLALLAALIASTEGPFGAGFSSSDPFRLVNIRAIYDDEDHSTAIVLWDGQGTTTAGTTYRNIYAWFMTLRDGKIIDGTAFYDSIAFDELWENVKP